MKKPLSLLLALLFTLSLTTVSRAEQALAWLTEKTGTVQVQHPGKDWQPLTEKGELVAGDRVRALAQSNAVIERSDGSVIELLPLAEILIVNEKGFLVQFGQVWSRFMKAVEGNFFLQSPTTTALIRGTVLTLSTDGTNTRVMVHEGHVTVQDALQRAQDVRGGEAINVRQGRLERLEKASYREIYSGRRFFERVQRIERLRRAPGHDPGRDPGHDRLQPMDRFQRTPAGPGPRERFPGEREPFKDQRERMIRERQDWVKEMRDRRLPPPPPGR